MRSFRDKTGRAWSIDLTIGAAKRVLQASGFDLVNPSSKSSDGRELVERLDGDLIAVYEVLWAFIEPQAMALGVTADAFGELMAADCIVEAQGVLFAEWADFFRRLQRPDMAAALETMARAKVTLTKAIANRASRLDVAAIQRKLDDQIEAMVGRQSGSSQDALASILDPTPSAS